jgi:hypothetical protein
LENGRSLPPPLAKLCQIIISANPSVLSQEHPHLLRRNPHLGHLQIQPFPQTGGAGGGFRFSAPRQSDAGNHLCGIGCGRLVSHGALQGFRRVAATRSGRLPFGGNSDGRRVDRCPGSPKSSETAAYQPRPRRVPSPDARVYTAVAVCLSVLRPQGLNRATAAGRRRN